MKRDRLSLHITYAMLDATEQFSAEIRHAGLVSPETIEADGKLHRFPPNGAR